MNAQRLQAGASTSGRPLVAGHALAPFRAQRLVAVRPVARASSTSSSGDDALKEAKVKFQKWAKENEIDKKAAAAAQAAAEAAELAKEKARRTWVRVDSEHRISEQFSKGARRAEEAARDLDQSYGIRRRLRGAAEYVSKKWPVWQRQLDEFTSTGLGKAAVFAGICLLVSTPLFWSLLNLLLLLWWLSIPLSLVLADYVRRKQVEAYAAQQEEAERAARARANPFAEIFRNAAAASSAGSARGSAAGGASSKGGRGAAGYNQDGPIIEAEWTSIDEEGNAKGGSKGGRR